MIRIPEKSFKVHNTLLYCSSENADKDASLHE
jgi:hypothetical protein